MATGCQEPRHGCQSYTSWTSHYEGRLLEMRDQCMSEKNLSYQAKGERNLKLSRPDFSLSNSQHSNRRKRGRRRVFELPANTYLRNYSIIRFSFLFVTFLFFSGHFNYNSNVYCLSNSISPISSSSQNNERILVVKQSATNPSTYKQSKQSFREIFKKINIHVKENTPIGTKLASVQPTEEDLLNHQSLPIGGGISGLSTKSPNDRITYGIVGGIDQQSFTLRVEDNSQNEVGLVNEVNFDYESDKRTYHVIIRATSIFLRYEVEVDIIVEDENDNMPQLEDFSIVLNNYKNNFPTGPIGRVPAKDLDCNDALRYRVLSGNNAQLIIVNETTGDIQLSPELNSNVPLRALMDITVSDGINEKVAKLVLTVNLVTELMLHNSVVLQLDGIGRDEFLSKKYDYFLSQMARILAPPQTLSLGSTASPTSSGFYSTNHIVVFDVEESHSMIGQQQAPVVTTDATNSASNEVVAAGPRSHSSSNSANTSLVSINVSFSARAADSNDVETYYSPRFIEERIFLNRIQLSQALDVHVAPFKDNLCVQEPCQNYQECQVTHKFDKASKVFFTSKRMIFRSIKSIQSYTCSCPTTFTGMKHKTECNLQINECFKNPCQNGGLCHRHESGSGYTCECRGDFFGPNCEHSFSNSTCQSVASAPLRGGSKISPSSSSPSSLSANGQQVCGGRARCVNLTRSHHFASTSHKSLTALSTSSLQPSGAGFTCQACPYPSQWHTELCQLRARSFDKRSYIVLPGLRRRHRFHLSLSFVTVQSDALLLYNGRYNDKHDFIALEIIDSRLKFSFSLGGNRVHSITLAHMHVSNGEWHKVSIDYRDRNVTLLVNDCDPIIDEALARLEPQQVGRCSNNSLTSSTILQSSELLDTQGPYHQTTDFRSLDLTGPMQVGALPSALINLASGSSVQQLASLSQSFSGCISDLHIDHQLVDLGSAPLQDFGTQPGCSDNQRSYCQQHTCNGFACQESFGAPKCQCGDERLGRSCELYLSQEKVRKFNGNSYLTFNPIDSQIPANWLASLYFRTINSNGVLFKIMLDQNDATVVLELVNGGLRLTHRQLHTLSMHRLQLDDGEWHHVEISWSGETAQIQLDHNANLVAQSAEMGQIMGSIMKSVIVGSSYTRSSALLASSSIGAVSSLSSPAPLSDQAAVAPEASTSDQPSTVSPPLTLPNGELGDPATNYNLFAQQATNGSQQNFIGCIFALNVSSGGIGAEAAADWWLSPNDERNVERGCPVVDVCDAHPCPASSRCVARGLSQRRCVCQPGFVGHEHCTPICELQPCQGDNSRCVPVVASSSSNTDEQRQPLGSSTRQAATASYTCECEPNRSGTNCEHQLSAKCPSNWWGMPALLSANSAGANSSTMSMCGPCNCDESRGFDGDCDKTSGDCFCKPNHYRPAGADNCLACDCYLVGSLSSACNHTSGQCKCRPGVVGRRCDSCSSPYAEVTLRGCEVIYDACPKSYSDGIWWDKTPLNKLASQQCPASTSTGAATRFCHETKGWQRTNLFDCISNTFTDLYTQYQFVEGNKFQMTPSLAMKIASQLRQALNETVSASLAATAQQANNGVQLYGSDMYISFRLLHHLIRHESMQSGMNLSHRQDRLYIRNIIESISYLLEPAHAGNWPEIAARSPQGGAEHLLRLMDTYGRVLIESQSDTFTQPFEFSTQHFVFGMDTISSEQLFDLSKWQQPSAPVAGNGHSSSERFPSSPPYATDPFDSPPPYQRHLTASTDQSAGGLSYATNFNADGHSIYLDFSATRDSSPSVVIPKYENYALDSASASTLHDQMQATRAVIPLRTLRIKTPRELPLSQTSAAGLPFPYYSAARRAKRDELLLTDYSRSQPQQQQRPALVAYSIYRTLGPLLPTNYDNSVQNRLGRQAQANSPVVWLTVRPANSSEFLTKSAQPKVTYMFKLLEPMGKTRPQCAVWDFLAPSVAASGAHAAPPHGQQAEAAGNNTSAQTTASSLARGADSLKQKGRFTARGCEIKGIQPNHRLRYKSDYVNCSCDHFGAVMVLMDSADQSALASSVLAAGDSDDDELAGASVRDLWLMAALALSLIVLAATLFVLSCIRGHSIKSNSNSINKNLLAILIIIELLVLYSLASRQSLQQQEYQCKLVAIFLHYFSISLFFWLLVNAVHFYRMLTELRDINHGPMKFYHILGYAVPAFFVSLAVGLRIEQFGNYLFCWLSIHEPIIWSMFGPIALVSMLTVILFKLALCKSLPLEKDIINQDPTGAYLIKMHMLINLAKTPLIGTYWLLTVYVVNEALVDWAALLFPLLVVLKSVILFVLLCVLDKYIRYNLYVSWLRFRGETVPFLEQQQPYLRGDGVLSGASLYQQGGQHWQAPLMSMPGEFGGQIGAKYHQHHQQQQQQHLHAHQSNGQMLYGGGGGQVQTPGFQSSCTDIFRPELFSAFSASSTTSRSTATGSSSAASGARRYNQGDELDYEDDEQSRTSLGDELDGASASDYGRANRHPRRRAGGHKHKRHHHHRHHHHHHHHHHGHYRHHRHAAPADDSAASLASQQRSRSPDAPEAEHARHERRHHGHHHHGHHHHGHRSRSHHARQAKEQHKQRRRDMGSHYERSAGSSSQQQLVAGADDGLASSHSSDRDGANELSAGAALAPHNDNDNIYAQRSGDDLAGALDDTAPQSAPVEPLEPSTSGQQ